MIDMKDEVEDIIILWVEELLRNSYLLKGFDYFRCMKKWIEGLWK